MAGPPPPPPPPPPAPPAPSGGNDVVEDTAGALFAEINALGADGVRSGLKKATRGPVNEEAPSEASQAVAPKPVAPKKTSAPKGKPICQLQGKKWCVENQAENREIMIEADSIKQTVYVYNCERSVIQVTGKCNSISIDKCKKVDLVFEDALSQVEIVNCDSVRVQCTGTAPSINIDGSQSITYFLSEESVANAMIITSKSAAINIIRPDPKDPDNIIETPIPEQFCTTFKNDEWVTEAVSHDD